MFTDKDYGDYFGELEGIYSKVIILYTDILNFLQDKAIACKLNPMAAENMEIFRFIKEEKKKFIKT